MFNNHPQQKSFWSQVYGTRDVNGANRTSLLLDGLGIGEDSHPPIHLQLSQPQQQNYETPTRATKLGYITQNISIMNTNLLCQNIDPKRVSLMTAADYNCPSTEDATGDGCRLVSINKRAYGYRFMLLSISDVWYKSQRQFSKKALVWNDKNKLKNRKKKQI